MHCRKRTFITAIAMCYMATLPVAQARPGYQSDLSQGTPLMVVPDLAGFSNIHYPQTDLIDLGSSSQGNLPPTEIKVTKTITVKEPYPVKVPHRVPYPVHIPKPYPVPVTKIIKVPQPVPVEVQKYHDGNGGGEGGYFGDGGGGSSGSHSSGASTNAVESAHYHYDSNRNLPNYAQDNGESYNENDASYEQNNNGSGEEAHHGYEDRSNVYLAITAADASANAYGRMDQKQQYDQPEQRQSDY